MPVTVGGVSLDGLAWNVQFIGDRLVTAGRRGQNLETSQLDGTVYRPNKPLTELYPILSMWVVGTDPDGLEPDEPGMRVVVRRRLDRLMALFGSVAGLVEVVDTDTARRCYAEVLGAMQPRTNRGGGRLEVSVPLVVPAGCWEDVAAFDTGLLTLPGAGTVTVVGAGGANLPVQGMVVELTPPASNLTLTTADGRWIKFNGPLPAGAATRLELNPRDPRAYQISAPGTSLIAAVELPDVVPLRIPVGSADPLVTVAATGVSGASKVRFQGRRRWASA